jgi:hypothetical protein
MITATKSVSRHFGPRENYGKFSVTGDQQLFHDSSFQPAGRTL